MTICKRERMREGMIPGAALAAERSTAHFPPDARMGTTELSRAADARLPSFIFPRARALPGPLRRDRRPSMTAPAAPDLRRARVAAG